MAGNYRIKIEPILDTAKLNKQLNETKQLKLGSAGTSAGNSFASSFGRAIKERFKYSIANAVIYGTQNAIKDMVNNVKELDAAQTEFKKVSDLTGASLEKFTQQAYAAGVSVAKTGTEMVQAATEFRKSGFNDQDSLKLANIASMYQNVADVEISAGEAANFIVSQMKAFKIEAKDAEHIIDAVNEVSNKYAVSSADIATNIGKTSAAMAAGNVTYEQTIGLMTGMIEITRSGAKAARGLVSIQSRYNQILDESSSTGKKLTDWYNEHGIAVKDSEGQLVSFYEVAQQVSKQWDSLSHNEQLYWANTQAGANQSQNLLSLMSNFSTTIAATETAYNSAGSAATENAKYLDSIEGHLQTFQSAWEKFSYDFMQSDFLKSAIDLGTNVINILDELITKTGITAPKALAILSGAFGAVNIIKNIDHIKTFIGFIEKFTSKIAKFDGFKIFEGLFGGATVAGTTSSANNALSTLFDTLSVGGITGKKAAEQFDDLEDEFEEIRRTAKDVDFDTIVDGVSEVAEGAAGAEVATGGLTSSLSGLLPTLGLIAGAIAAIVAAFAIAKASYDSTFRGKVEKLTEMKDELSNIQSEIEQLESKEGDLNNEEQARLNLLKAQENILRQQVALKEKETTAAFNKEAEQKFNNKATGYAKDSQYAVGTKAINAYQNLRDIEKEINELEEKRQKYGLTTTEEERVKRLTNSFEEAVKASEDWNESLIEEHELLENVRYDRLSEAGKSYYDNIHSAYLQMASDSDEVRMGIEDVINTYGSAQFDSWNIDVSSLENAEQLAEQVYEKINSMDNDEEITLYARDETGQIIDEITHKKGDLTNEEWQMVINAQATGDWDKVENYVASQKVEDRSVLLEFQSKGAQRIEAEKKALEDDANTTLTYTQRGIPDIQKAFKEVTTPTNTILGFKPKGLQSIANTYESIKDKSITITTYQKTVKENATGKRKGEQGGLSWLGDEGSAQNPKPELVVSEDGAYLAGTTGWELYNLKSSDTVYTASQTRKLLSENQRFFGVSTDELPRFKKGKKSSSKKSSKKKSKKKKNSSTTTTTASSENPYETAYDDELTALEYRRKVEHWTDATYIAERQALYNRYAGLIDVDNYYNMATAIDDIYDKLAAEEASRFVGLVGVGGMSAASAVANINAQSHLTADEKRDYRAQAYKESVEYNLKEYQNGKQTREQIIQDIQNYYNTRGKADETYYEMLDNLREADKEKELKRLQDLQEAQDNSLTLAQKYIQKELDAVNKQIEADEEEAEQLERIVELQKDLTKARSTKVRVYKEGIGFVYERDTEAVEEAEKALLDYQKSLSKTPLEEYAEQLESILDLFDELANDSDIKELELLLGVSDLTQLTGGNLGTDLSAWSTWITKMLAQSTAYADLIEQLGNVSGTDIDSWLSNNQQISAATIAQYIAKHSFASGTLSAPSGLSLVGEHGAEIRMLNKGDTIFNAARSRNLLEWSNYTPTQIAKALDSSTSNQVFNFDKIVLPNVRNAEDFYRELQNLPNQALQQSLRRA